jgi:hypothetical protein
VLPETLRRNLRTLFRFGLFFSVRVKSQVTPFDYPIESALTGEAEGGWRAANPGAQRIRLIFDEPQRLGHIFLVFEDTENTRTQEFALRWSPDSGHFLRELVRQQWNFSPPSSVRELEGNAVELSEVTVFEPTIVPDKSGGEARASLLSLRLA